MILLSGIFSSQKLTILEPAGPALQCPYVMDSRSSGYLGLEEFTSWSYQDGVLTATNNAGGGNQASQATLDYDRQEGEVPSGESAWWSIAPGNGKIAFEAKITEISDVSGQMNVSIFTGNPMDNNYVRAACYVLGTSNYVYYNVQGVGSRQLFPSEGGLFETNQFYDVSIGDRISIVVDTDTGALDYISEVGHENFEGVPVIDMSDGAGVVFSLVSSTLANTPQSGELYTKVSDMKLPAPVGTKDVCLNGGLKELITYPLDEVEETAISMGYTGRLDLSLAQQRTQYLIQPTLSQSETYIAASSNLLLDTNGINLSGPGRHAFEVEQTLPNFTHQGTPTGSQLYHLQFNLIDPVQGLNIPPIQFDVYCSDNNVGSTSITAHEGEASGPNILLTEPTDTGGRYKFGFLVDSVNKNIRIWKDDIEMSLTTNTLPAGWNGSNLYPVISVTQSTVPPDNAEGTAVVCRFITEPYFFTTQFPLGSLDIEGNVFDIGVIFDEDETASLASAAGIAEMTINQASFSSAGVDTATSGPVLNTIGTLDRVIELTVTSSSGSEQLQLAVGDTFDIHDKVTVPASVGNYLVILDANDSLQLFDSAGTLVDADAISVTTRDDITVINLNAGSVEGYLTSNLNDFVHDWTPVLTGQTVYDWKLSDSKTF